MPNPVRVLLIVALAFTLSLGRPKAALTDAYAISTSAELIAAVLTELAIGAMMALGVNVAFGAIAIGGRLLDVQIGYGIAQVFDPATHRQTPILTTLLNQLGTMVFFVSDFHHVLLRGLSLSLERIPVGHGWSIATAAAPLMRHAGAMFGLGFALVSPIVFCMLMLEFGLTILARNAPQLHLFMLNHALKILVGITAIGLWLVGAPEAMARMYRVVFLSWEAMFPHG
jgi:flagellar biosynthetic protein FliR